MHHPPPISTRTATLFPFTTLFLSVPAYPHFLQLRGIADGALLLFDVVARDRLAVQRALALAIGGLEAGGDCVEFGRSTRRRRRWQDDALLQYAKLAAGEIGRASCRERVCQYV